MLAVLTFLNNAYARPSKMREKQSWRIANDLMSTFRLHACTGRWVPAAPVS
jgi:hypothetical protein